jgi:transposase
VDFCPGTNVTGGEKSMKKPGRNHSAKFKAQIAVDAIRGEKTVADIAAHREVHPNQVTAWKTQVLKSMAAIFGRNVLADDGKEQIRLLREKAGEPTNESDVLEGAFGKVPDLSGER